MRLNFLSKQVELAIFDNDLKARTVKKYDLSEDGTKIRVKSGGEAHWMPTFDNDSFLELPKRKKYFLFGSMTWRRLYFVKRNAAKCVDFKTETVSGPDPEQLKEAVGGLMLKDLGKGGQETPLWVYIIVLGILAIAGKVFGVIV